VNGVRVQIVRFAEVLAIGAKGEVNLKRALESLNVILKVTTK